MQAHVTAVFVVGLILAGSALLPDSVRAQSNAAQPPAGSLESSPIGKVVTTSGSVTVEHARAVVVQVNLPAASGVGQTKLGDLVQTGADGKVGITFTDGTAFNLSSNARMVLDEFVYDPNGKSNSTLFSLTKGTFTFVAGKVAKTGDMKIETPVATMGIRGTTPHVEISDDGSVRFSTLIEENKGGVTERRGGIEENKRGAPVKRQAKRESSSDAVSAQQAENKPNRNFDINLRICRGC